MSAPILHLNGYKIANPTVLARIADDELTALPLGYGYEPYLIAGDAPSLCTSAWPVHSVLSLSSTRSTCEPTMSTCTCTATRKKGPPHPSMMTGTALVVATWLDPTSLILDHACGGAAPCPLWLSCCILLMTGPRRSFSDNRPAHWHAAPYRRGSPGGGAELVSIAVRRVSSCLLEQMTELELMAFVFQSP